MNASEEFIPIEEASRRLGLTTSALRYYDERGLVAPVSRAHGRRWYGRAELRRLAFVAIARRLGLPLAAVATVLDEPRGVWRDTARAQLDELDAVIARAEIAKDFLRRALECPADHPTRECPSMTDALDALVDGCTVDELVRRVGAADEVPSPRNRAVPGGVPVGLGAPGEPS